MVRLRPEKLGKWPVNLKVAVTAPPVAVWVVASAAGASTADAASTRTMVRRRRMPRASYPLARAPPMLRVNVSSVHLHDPQALPALPARQRGPHRHLAVVLPRRQDRRPGLQRRGQVHAVADHGPDR